MLSSVQCVVPLIAAVTAAQDALLLPKEGMHFTLLALAIDTVMSHNKHVWPHVV